MVRYALTLGLLGLSAVSNALPTVQERQFSVGGGSTTLSPGLAPCLAGVPLSEQPPCFLTSTGTFASGKARRFTLPPDASTNINGAIDTLEKQLEQLQNKKDKTDQDYEEIADVNAALAYLVGITSISAPAGSTTTFHPGKRDDVGAYATECPNLDGAELALERLLQKGSLSVQEYLIAQRLSNFLLACGITIVKSPDGTTTTLKPSDKRDTSTLTLEPVTAKPDFDLAGVEKAYEALIQSVGDSKPSFATWLAIQHLEAILKAYGVTIVKSPTGTTTTIKPSDKRQVFTIVDNPTTGPSTSFKISDKRQVFTIVDTPTTGPSTSFKPSDKRQVFTIVDTPTTGPTTTFKPSDKRQTFTVGTQTCQLSDVLGLKAALAALTAAYGEPGKAPKNVLIYEQVIVAILNLCGQTVDGWTTLTPGNPVPGGAIVPDPVTTGAPVVPDPVTTGSPVVPSDRRMRRQDTVEDPAALLDALELLESQYGNYGSGTIPVPVFLIMQSMVVILQEIPGVVVPGWPVLGAGSTTIQPSD